MEFPLKLLTIKPGHVVQSVTCVATDACLTADPGILVWSHTFVEIDYEIIFYSHSREGLLSVTNESMCTKY